MTLKLLVAVALAVAAVPAPHDEWSRFRGPNGSGISAATNLPVEFGPEKNLIWKLDLPQGHSSPILFRDRIYLTGFREKDLFTIVISDTGKILWETKLAGLATPPADKRNNAASPSPAVDDSGIYVFFHDFGLISYGFDGKERWRLPLGPFINLYGMGASPVIVGDLVILAADQSLESYVMGVDKKTGRQVWKTMRPEAKSGHSTPILWTNKAGEQEVLLPGSFLLTAYDVKSGAKKWWTSGLSFEMKSVPVVAKVGGTDMLFVNGYGSPENDPGKLIDAGETKEIFAKHDADGNGTLEKTELPTDHAKGWLVVYDLDTNGIVTPAEWDYYRAALASRNGMLAIRLGGEGDMTAKNVVWQYQRSVPQLPSPIVYGGVLYMVNDGGIMTTLNPETGAVVKQGRIPGAIDRYYASPVAGDGKVYMTSEKGKIAVLRPDGNLEPVAVNDIGEDIYATPA
nr:PQQ-binding-like beta-propeller repeat protein [Acidobacteriota bacterium]